MQQCVKNMQSSFVNKTFSVMPTRQNAAKNWCIGGLIIIERPFKGLEENY